MTRARGALLGVISAGVLGAFVPSGAHAQDATPESSFELGGNGSDALVDGVTPGNTDEGVGTGVDKVVATIPGPYTEYLYASSCSSDPPEFDAGDGVLVPDGNCPLAQSCADDAEFLFNVFTLGRDADGSPQDGADFIAAGQQCRGPNDPPEGGPAQITVADIAEQAREASPETVVNVEPVDRSYVNLPTNFYGDSDAVDTTVTVLGQDIGLRFEPSGFAWAYGDGASGDGAGVAGSKVGGADAVEHAYRRSGDVSVTLTRTFDVTFTLPGGETGTLPAPGVPNTSDPYPLEIREIQSTVTDIG